MRRFGAVVVLLAGLSSCTLFSPEQRVQRALVQAGIKPTVAHCMAERMARRLSIAQLRRLQAAAGPLKGDGAVGVHEVIRRLRALDDPEIVGVTTRAAVGCEITDG